MHDNAIINQEESKRTPIHIHWRNLLDEDTCRPAKQTAGLVFLGGYVALVVTFLFLHMGEETSNEALVSWLSRLKWFLLAMLTTGCVLGYAAGGMRCCLPNRDRAQNHGHEVYFASYQTTHFREVTLWRQVSSGVSSIILFGGSAVIGLWVISVLVRVLVKTFEDNLQTDQLCSVLCPGKAMACVMLSVFSLVCCAVLRSRCPCRSRIELEVTSENEAETSDILLSTGRNSSRSNPLVSWVRARLS